MSENKIMLMDAIDGMRGLPNESVDCVLIDPPYNIGYDFGNNKCKKETQQYLKWSDQWLGQASRILKPSGTIFVYGFSEILAHISARTDLDHRWLIWHYTNKTVPSSHFWQRSHEAILCMWKDKSKRIFNREDVREPYTENYVKGYKGKNRKRTNTSGRFGSSKGTTYTVNEKGALPRDVIKQSALAGGAGVKSRISFCKDCGVSLLGRSEAKEHENHEIVKHPTQKPFQITKRLLLSCMPAGGTVVVPFAGTGSECLVANVLGFNFVGYDLNPDFVAMANDVVKKEIEL